MLFNDLRFGISLALEGLIWPSKTLYKIQATGFQPTVVVRRICLPLLPLLFVLGFVGLQLWGKPLAFWNFEHIDALDALLHLMPAYLLALVLMGSVLFSNWKFFKGKTLTGNGELQRKCLLGSIVLLSSGLFFCIPYLSHLFFLPIISAIEILGTRQGR
jgi:hypothetical protein